MKFQIEIQRVLNLLCNDIYDSPYALLRENMQNSYDAILMRLAEDDTFKDPTIRMTLTNELIKIEDNGIGMTLDVIENNFWRAGSSGKNNESARKAGVVGTFGIGAMANFGVCEHLKVLSRYYKNEDTIITEVSKENLSLTEHCINTIENSHELLNPGTTVLATLSSSIKLSIDEAKQYLSQYVKYLAIPVYLNEELISQNDYSSYFMYSGDNVVSVNRDFENQGLKFKLDLSFLNYNNGSISIKAYNLNFHDEDITGEIVLRQDENVINGLRNGFGLASLPISTSFNFGGIANLSFLVPTAGREALSRDSISIVSQILQIVEIAIAETYASYEICDSNRGFIGYINNRNRIDLSGLIKIMKNPGEERIQLNRIEPKMDGKNVYFYSGQDPQIIAQFANENSSLITLSRDGLRRSIQLKALSTKSIESIPDNARVLRVFKDEQLETSEFALVLRIRSVLESDYFLSNSSVHFAEISHSQPNMIESDNGRIIVYLSKKSGSVIQLLEIYKQNFFMFDGFVKDYIRNSLYAKLSSYVPSATRMGADALIKVMQKKKELYSIESTEVGALDDLIKEYLTGKLPLENVFKAASTMHNSQKQIVNADHVGSVESIIQNIVNENSEKDVASENSADLRTYLANSNLALPPIKRLENATKSKILKTESSYPSLNGFQYFLSLSDRLFNSNVDFFLEPHTTKVIWSMHKIIYIFTHASNKISLYYDIELKDKLPNEMTGGCAIPTTTIITKNKVFIPIIPEMNPYFNILSGSKEFFVRFDTVIQE